MIIRQVVSKLLAAGPRGVLGEALHIEARSTPRRPLAPRLRGEALPRGERLRQCRSSTSRPFPSTASDGATGQGQPAPALLGPRPRVGSRGQVSGKTVVSEGRPRPTHLPVRSSWFPPRSSQPVSPLPHLHVTSAWTTPPAGRSPPFPLHPPARRASENPPQHSACAHVLMASLPFIPTLQTKRVRRKGSHGPINKG